MQTNESRIRVLLTRYEAAETTEAEESELRALLQRCDDLPSDLRWARRLFAGMADLAHEQLPLRQLKPAMSLLRRSPKRFVGRIVAAAVAAAAVVALVVVHELRTPYCYIDGRPIYDREEAMASMSCLAQLDRLDRSLMLWDEWLFTNKTNK
nr:hypothetical protein [Rikenellaceae bacterium]